MSLVVDRRGVHGAVGFDRAVSQLSPSYRERKHENGRCGEVLRPPTRNRVVAGRERTLISCTATRERTHWFSLAALAFAVMGFVVGIGFWVSAVAVATPPASTPVVSHELGEFDESSRIPSETGVFSGAVPDGLAGFSAGILSGE